ncbi:unnamed protein product [Phytomonas sp. Hart1]|nr:unnamed protein product [Phytomonas sp. Hart1]|eukprot:CCW68192.1 unnamed protein product [Phytomonas sp. isolate Hart1]
MPLFKKTVPQTKVKSSPSFVIKDRFLVQCRIGKGSFGDVYRGRDLNTNANVAIKIERLKSSDICHLYLEKDIYRRLNISNVTVGIPNIYYYGVLENYAILVIDLLGPSLEDLFSYCNSSFNLKTVCMLGVQIFQRLEYIHKIGLIYRDIKPDNFVMGLGPRSHILYVIDMGLSKYWRTPSGKHLNFVQGKALTGTARYVSIHTHNGLEQSRRDDVESAAYLIMYLLRGNLPWQGVKCSDTNYKTIGVSKAQNTGSKLASGYPVQFAELVNQVRSLGFNEEPHYKLYVSLLLSVMNMNSENFDYNYSWCGMPSLIHPKAPVKHT